MMPKEYTSAAQSYLFPASTSGAIHLCRNTSCSAHAQCSQQRDPIPTDSVGGQCEPIPTDSVGSQRAEVKSQSSAAVSPATAWQQRQLQVSGTLKLYLKGKGACPSGRVSQAYFSRRRGGSAYLGLVADTEDTTVEACMTRDRLKSATFTRQCLSTSRLALLRSLRSRPRLLQPCYQPSPTSREGA